MVVAAASGGAIVASRQGLDDPPRDRVVASGPSDPPVVPGRLVYLDGTRDPSTVFRPLRSQPRSGGVMGAQLAFNALVQDASKFSPMPASVRAYYGRLTDRDASPMATRTRVWGFAAVAGCVTTGGPVPIGSPAPSPAPPQRCRQWEFVDARTGHDLGVFAQEVLPD